MPKASDKLREAAETIRSEWIQAGDDTVQHDSPPADFAEPERHVDADALERERERLLEEQRHHREVELSDD